MRKIKLYDKITVDFIKEIDEETFKKEYEILDERWWSEYQNAQFYYDDEYGNIKGICRKKSKGG